MVSASAALFALAGGLALVLAAGLLALDFHHRGNRAFAFVLASRGLTHALFSLALVAPLAGPPEYWLRLLPYLVIAFPFANAYFVSVYPRRRRWVPAGPWGAVPFLAALALAEAWYVLEGRAYALDFSGPLALFARLNEVVIPAMALVFAFEASRAAPGPLRGSSMLLSAGFGLTATHALLVTAPRAEYALANVAVAVLALGLAAQLAWNLRRGDAGLRRMSGRYLVALGVAALTGLAVLAAGPAPAALPGGAGDSLEVAMGGVWRMAFPVAATYALARHQLFGIDLKVKRTVQGSTVALAFILTYLAVSQGALAFLDAGGARTVGLLAVGLLLAAIVPLWRLGRAVADSALPGVQPGPAYLDARKLEVYRAALEAGLGQAPSEAGRERLARLRAELGITDRDHAVLEHALRAAEPGSGDLAPGHVVLGRYRVEALLGEGGHGKAYRARDEAAGGDVVVKVIPAARRGEAVVREARALGAVRHPHVAALLDAAQAGSQAFLVMEHVAGGSLKERLRAGPLGAEDFARVARGALQALEAVHAAGVVHRDVKPSNVLLTAEGEPKLADFGVAHLPGFETTAGGAGQAVGTVQYMSPEQALGRPCTPQSDLYSLAATLHEAHTGQPYLPPRLNESAVELQIRAASGKRFPARWPGDPRLRAWFARALDPDPGRRFASARAMREALEQALARPA